MANADFPRGLWPLYHLTGGEIRQKQYVAGGTVYLGDLVTLTSDGLITACSAGTIAIGVAMNYAVITGVVLVVDDPMVVFGIQAAYDNGGTAAFTNIGNNADIIATTGNTTTLISAHELDTNTFNSTTAQLRVIDIINTPDNAWGNHVKLAVLINEHMFKTVSLAGI